MTLSQSKLGEERPTNVRWIIFALSCGLSFFLYFHRYTWNLVSPEIKKELNYSDFQMQILLSTFMVTYGFLQFPAVMIAHRIGARNLLTISLILWSIATGLHGFTLLGFAGLFVVRLLMGVAQAACYPTLAETTRCWYPMRYRTAVQSWIASFCGRAGGAVSPIVFGSLLIVVLGLSWRSSLVVMALIGCLYAILFYVLFRSDPNEDSRVNTLEREHIQENKAPVQPAILGDWKSIMLHLPVMMLMLQQFVIAGADNFFSGMTGEYFKSRGLTIGGGAILTMLPLLGGALGGVASGLVNDAMLNNRKRRLLFIVPLLGAGVTLCRKLIDAGLNTIDYFGLLMSPVPGFLIGIPFALILSMMAGNARWSRSTVAFLCNLGAATMMVDVMRQETALDVAITLFTVKFFADMTQPTQWGACLDVGGRVSGSVFSLVNFAGTVGGIFIPPLFGKLLDLTNKNYLLIFYSLAGLYVCGAFSWLFADCTNRYPSKETLNNVKEKD